MKATPQKKRVQLRASESENLLGRARKGSNEAFRQLVLMHQQAIRIYVARYVHCAGSADDIAQEVFVTAHKQLGQFRGESTFSTWLMGIARNKAKQYLRMEMRRRKLRQEFAESKLSLSLKALQRDSDLTVEEQRLNLLQECLGQIPEPSKSLVESFYFRHQSSISIAAKLDQKESTIRMKLLRIRKLLHKCITGKMKS